jgi:EmrB/QacA subfamily drug resistance transporter
MSTSSPQRGMLWVIAAGFFMQTLDTTIVNTALPAMAHSLGETALAMRPVVVAYSLTMAMVTPASGWLADRFGTRHVYFYAILLFTLGSLLCATSGSLEMLVAARVLQGLGGAMLLPIGRLAVLRSMPGAQYVAAFATISTAGQTGPLVGPVAGGWLVQTLSWHWIFLINIPIGLFGLYAVRRYLPRADHIGAASFDFLGFGLLSTCMVAFSLSLDPPVQEHKVAWGCLLFGLSVLTVTLYIWHARRRARPLFRLGLFRNATFSVGLIGNLVCRLGTSGMPFLLPLLLQLQMGYGPFGAGMMMVPVAAGGVLAKSWVAPLLRRVGYENFLIYNTIFAGACIILFGLIGPDWPLWIQLVLLAAFGAVTSLQYSAMNSVTLVGLEPADAGSGNSLFSMVQMLALGLGVTVCGGLVGIFSDGPHATLTGFRLTFVCIGAITLLSGFVFRRLDAEGLETGPKTSARGA